MAKLERKNVKIFCSDPNSATQVTSFLTALDPVPSPSSDPDIIQNTYYPKGWLAKGKDNLPQAEDLNGVLYAESYKTAYLYQKGIAEWLVTQEYSENSFCQVSGVLYQSKTDNNIGNDPTIDDGTNWTEIAFEPYVGQNIGTAEGIYAGKTSDNELQFKSLAVSGNANITASDDTITIAVGGGETGAVYWGAIDGDLSDQSDLQQALNLKQNAIGYTPENQANKVTTVRSDLVATDTAYPTEKATRTAIDNAVTSANNYTDSALQNLATDAFVLYADSWTNIDTGTLTTTPPTGTGTNHTLHSISSSSYENIANFTYTTTQETVFNNTFTYDILVPIRNANIYNWHFKFNLAITHADVNSGTPTILVDYESGNLYPTNGNLNIEIKQDLVGVDSITYPVGSVITFHIEAKSDEVPPPHNFDLLVYDQTSPLIISRNKGINKNLVTAFNTQALGTLQNQEYFNTYMLEQLTPMTATSPLTISSNNISIGSASTSTSGALSSTDWNTFNGKQDTITASTPLSLSSNTLSIAKATTSASGYLSSADWNTFNKKVSANNSTIYIKMNGANKGSFTTNASSGTTIDLGTVITSTSDCAKLAGTNTFTQNNIFTGDIYLRKTNSTDVVLQNNGARPRFVYTLDGTGYACVATKTAWNFSSDRRLKKNIKSIENGLEVVEKLNPVKFDFKNDKRNDSYESGFIAQEVKEVIPQAITEDENGYLSLGMNSITPYLAGAIKELNEKITKLEARIEELEGK